MQRNELNSTDPKNLLAYTTVATVLTALIGFFKEILDQCVVLHNATTATDDQRHGGMIIKREADAFFYPDQSSPACYVDISWKFLLWPLIPLAIGLCAYGILMLKRHLEDNDYDFGNRLSQCTASLYSNIEREDDRLILLNTSQETSSEHSDDDDRPINKNY